MRFYNKFYNDEELVKLLLAAIKYNRIAMKIPINAETLDIMRKLQRNKAKTSQTRSKIIRKTKNDGENGIKNE